MGIFNLVSKADVLNDGLSPGDDTKYVLEGVIGLEMHESINTALNYLSIGGYNEFIVSHPENI